LKAHATPLSRVDGPTTRTARPYRAFGSAVGNWPSRKLNWDVARLSGCSSDGEPPANIRTTPRMAKLLERSLNRGLAGRVSGSSTLICESSPKGNLLMNKVRNCWKSVRALRDNRAEVVEEANHKKQIITRSLKWIRKSRDRKGIGAGRTSEAGTPASIGCYHDGILFRDGTGNSSALAFRKKAAPEGAARLAPGKGELSLRNQK
jgi:hypothetical protein